jgi:hypothetical protein
VLGYGICRLDHSIKTTATAVDDDFVDKQWPEPLIFRFNSQEYKVFIKVDRNISIETRIEGPGSSYAIGYTEVCALLVKPSTRLNSYFVSLPIPLQLG